VRTIGIAIMNIGIAIPMLFQYAIHVYQCENNTRPGKHTKNDEKSACYLWVNQL
jgi:hypothetical protein